MFRLTSGSSSLAAPVDLLGAPWVGDSGPDLANIYLHARYYDPALGIFLSPDPIGADMNTYRYGLGNPTNFRDPSGLVASSASSGGMCIDSTCYFWGDDGVIVNGKWNWEDAPGFGGYGSSNGSGCGEYCDDAFGNTGGGADPEPQGPATTPTPIPPQLPFPEHNPQRTRGLLRAFCRPS